MKNVFKNTPNLFDKFCHSHAKIKSLFGWKDKNYHKSHVAHEKHCNCEVKYNR